jgi:hypothetical protein
LNALSLDGDLRDEQAEYAQNVYVYHLVKAANALANASRKDAGGGPRNSVQDISVGFGLGRLHLNVICKEAPGVVVYTDPAEEDEGELDTVLDGTELRCQDVRSQRAHPLWRPQRSLSTAQRSPEFSQEAY